MYSFLFVAMHMIIGSLEFFIINNIPYQKFECCPYIYRSIEIFILCHVTALVSYYLEDLTVGIAVSLKCRLVIIAVTTLAYIADLLFTTQECANHVGMSYQILWELYRLEHSVSLGVLMGFIYHYLK